MKLEVKYLQHYLSHRLLCDVKGHDGNIYKSVELTSISTRSSYEHLEFVDIGGREMMPSEICMIHIEDVKPLWHPLSSLTKEIEHNGEKFVPIERIFNPDVIIEEYESQEGRKTITATYNIKDDTYTDFIIHEGSINQTDYHIVQKLFEWHFNVFNLPEELYIKKS